MILYSIQPVSNYTQAYRESSLRCSCHRSCVDGLIDGISIMEAEVACVVCRVVATQRQIQLQTVMHIHMCVMACSGSQAFTYSFRHDCQHWGKLVLYCGLIVCVIRIQTLATPQRFLFSLGEALKW